MKPGIDLNKRVCHNLWWGYPYKGQKEEYESLRSHFGTLKRGEHSKYLPYAFTEQGVAMLSSVLNSQRSIEVNIHIMRTFVKLREMLSNHKDLARKLVDMEKKYDTQFYPVRDFRLCTTFT